MAEIDVDADRTLLRRQVRPQGFDAGPLYEADEECGREDRRHLGKAGECLGDGRHRQTLVDKDGLPVTQARFQLIE